MPDTPLPHPGTTMAPRQWPRLALLTLGVLLGHGVLLRAAPLALAAATLPATTATPVGAATWTTRTLATAVPWPPTGVQAPRPPRPPAAPVHAQRPVSTPVVKTLKVTQNPEPILPSTRIKTGEDATESIASAATDTAATQVAQAQPAARLVGTTPTIDLATVQRFAIPAPLRLTYVVRGQARHIPYTVNGELLWQHDGTNYQARLEISHFLLGSRVQTSKGQLTARGLEPVRFGDKVRSEVAAHFERSKNKISYSANTPDEALQPGAQDQLSVFMQLAAMLSAQPERFNPGTSVAFQAVGPRSSEQWVFQIGSLEWLDLPAGKVQALKLTKDPVGEHDSRSELWLAPELGYLPVRIRLSQSNGDFVDQLWSATQKP